MKKLFTISAIVLFSTVVFAGGTALSPKSISGIAVVKSPVSGLFKVYYKAAETANVKVSILNDKDQTVFFETIRKVDGFIRPYSFSNLPEGMYTIRIEDGTTVQAEKVEYRSGEIAKLIQVRKVLAEEGKYLFTATGKGQESIRINIYNPADQLLYTESRLVKDTFATVYNLSKVKGAISFEVVHSNGTSQKLNY
ncbi:MAG TPA: hypothetical protein VIT44_15350 [Cyclobacteriaceae bacterium]